MSARHLAEIGLPAYSLASAGLLGPVLDGPVCDQTPLGGQIGWVDIRGGHVGEKLDVDGGFFLWHPTKRSGSRSFAERMDQ